MRTTKSSARKYATIGGVVGLLDGLALVLSIHSSFSFLTPILLLLALPCFAVALRLDGARFPEWVPWAAGVLTMALLGAAVGLIVHWLRGCMQPDDLGVVRPAVKDESSPNSSGGF
jgi:hypothetical protein